MNIAVITCDVLTQEIRHFCQGLPQVKRIEVVEQGLHNTPALLKTRVQEMVDQVERDAEIDAIVLGYGLCSRGTEGLRAQRCKLVMARAHDCITLLLGSKERYAQYVKDHPGTYWYSPGWNRCHVPPGPERHRRLHCEYCEKYGTEDADYLMDMEQSWLKTYDQATYVHLGVGATPEDVGFTKGCADWLKWNFDEQTGDPSLLRALLSGEWDEARFLVLEPGQSFRFTADERILEVVNPVP